MRLLGINDFHGALEPPAGSGGTITSGGVTTTVGGAAFLATKLNELRAGQPNNLFIGAGDQIGASPLISGLFHDEPTIEALNLMGMNYSGVGNHEFDEGVNELIRMQFGGCHPVDGCQDGDPFLGADFRYLAANVRYKNSDQTILPPFMIRHFGGIPMAVIGLTLKATPDVVTPEGVAGLAFDEEAQSINRLVRELSDRGIEAFTVAIHEGGRQNAPFTGGSLSVNGCDNPSGDIFPILDRLSAKVDVVLSAHTHNAYVCNRNGMLVTSSSSSGRLVTRVDLSLDGVTGDVKNDTAVNELVVRTVAPNPQVQALIDKYKALAAPIANEVVGQITAAISRSQNPAGESPLGDLIADSQLAATAPQNKGGAVIAFMNPGGIRADLPFNAPSGNVTYNDLFTVQPFGNTLTVKTLTGAQIERLLEQQFNNPSAGANRILQVSNGFTYTWKMSGPAGDRVDPASVKLNGVTLDPAANYRVTMNSFLATGGDGFTVFNEGTNQIGGDVDIDAAEAYLRANSPVSPPAANRITVIA